MKVAFENCGIQFADITQGFQEWLAFTAASLVSNALLPYGEHLMKSLSHMGGVRLPSQQVREIFKNSRGKQFSIYRERIYDEQSRRSILAFRVTKDCGNVAYKDFFEQVAVPEAKDRNEIFGPTRASAEKTGDIIELWLGILDVANMAQGTVNVFPCTTDPAEFLNGLEKSLAEFVSTSRTTSTINDKRKGSFDCTLQPAEAEKVLKILNEIPNYERLEDFNCLTKWEEAQVTAQYRKLHGISVDDVNMGDETTTGLGDESTTHPGKEEVEEPQVNATDIVRESEMSGRQQLLDALGSLYTVSENVSVCLYCGSTQHGHDECQDEKRINIKKTLKALRATLEADSASQEDVEMSPRGQRGKEGSGESGSHEEPAEARSGDFHWYDSIRTMAEVGDLDEAGPFCIEGREVSKVGPNRSNDLHEVIREAILRGGGDSWTVPDFLASYSDVNTRKEYYKRIEAPTDDFLKIIPTTGCHFHNYEFFKGVEYENNYTFDNNNKLSRYEDKVSQVLNRILRHKVGKASEGQSLYCDDAGRVPIDDVLRCEAVWKHDYCRRPHVFLAPRGRSNDKGSWNRDEANYRMQLLFLRLCFTVPGTVDVSGSRS